MNRKRSPSGEGFLAPRPARRSSTENGMSAFMWETVTRPSNIASRASVRLNSTCVCCASVEKRRLSCQKRLILLRVSRNVYRPSRSANGCWRVTARPCVRSVSRRPRCGWSRNRRCAHVPTNAAQPRSGELAGELGRAPCHAQATGVLLRRSWQWGGRSLEPERAGERAERRETEDGRGCPPALALSWTGGGLDAVPYQARQFVGDCRLPLPSLSEREADAGSQRT